MDWFERLTGFRETGYLDTRTRLEVVDGRLRSRVNGSTYGIGSFEMISLDELRKRVAAGPFPRGSLRVSVVQGDVRAMHCAPEYAGALFQVASQFNALEMIGPDVSPEDGVSRYEHDHTQGPACAVAAGAALLYRNFFVPVPGGGLGQTAQRQLDGLSEVGHRLGQALGVPVRDLWSMENGYCLCTRESLAKIGDYLRGMGPDAVDVIARELRVGVHTGVEVTDGPLPGQLVSQVFCSALPVAYGRAPREDWRAFAQLVLDAAYEATLLAAVLNARHGASNIALLTLLGGGAFGNAPEWIYAALKRALRKVSGFALDVRLVSFGRPPATLEELAHELTGSTRALPPEHP